MADVFSTVSGAIELVKKLHAASTASKDATSKLIIADLTVKLAELKMELAELMNENTDLKAKVAKAASPVEMVHKDDAYFKPDGDGPFCTACFDSAGKVIRLSAAPGYADFKLRCNVCKGHFGRTPLSLPAAFGP